jgi:hypothetical protein
MRIADGGFENRNPNSPIRIPQSALGIGNWKLFSQLKKAQS